MNTITQREATGAAIGAAVGALALYGVQKLLAWNTARKIKKEAEKTAQPNANPNTGSPKPDVNAEFSNVGGATQAS